jgi:pimeloyl-ACP methyl ester carboxylesterase
MPQRLVVIVPSITGEIAPWQPLIERLKQLDGYTEADCDWYMARHNARWYWPGSAMQSSLKVSELIHEQWMRGGGYDDVVLTGHSLGGLLARQAYLLGLDTDSEGRNSRPWAGKVSRIVLFASLNRGIEVSFARRWWLPPVAWFSRVLPGLRRWLVHDLLRGSDFVTNLRISWIRELNSQSHPPLVTQFRGTEDTVVMAEDSSDIEEFPTGKQEVLPGATHANLVQLDIADDPDARFQHIAQAFTIPRSPATVPAIGTPNQRVIMLLHGIRASNTTWVRDLENQLHAAAPDADVVTASYGHFSARKFILPVTRRKFLGWLEDVYAERLAKNPKATFHFVGHSNGTYLLGNSLSRIPGMRFDRVFLAGSVLPTDYPWRERLANGQVRHIRNDRAARDIPVGILCAGLRGLHMRDVGTGGVDGFYTYSSSAKTEVFYYPGGHSAALAPANLPHLVRYILNGTTVPPPVLLRATTTGFGILSRAAGPLFAILTLAALAAVATFGACGPFSPLLNVITEVGTFAVLFLLLDLV